METDLFGHAITYADPFAKPITDTARFGTTINSTKFSDSAVDALLDFFPARLLNDLNNCLAGLRREVHRAGTKSQAADIDMGLGLGNQEIDFGPGFEMETQEDETEVRKDFYSFVEWVYDLAERPAVIPFEQACLHEAMDPEFIRTSIARAFANEMREFFFAYATFCEKHNFNDHVRVKRKLRQYILIEH